MTGIGYYEHRHNKYLYLGLQDYLSRLPDMDESIRYIPRDLLIYREYLLQHFVTYPKPLYEIEVRQEDGYPTEEFLISLLETAVPLQTRRQYHRLMETVSAAWNCIHGSVEHRGNTYVMYTGGWSGNEDILDALFSNPAIWIYIRKETSSRNPAVVRIGYLLAKKTAH